MIKLTDNLWIGDSASYKGRWGPDGTYTESEVNAVLNVAMDLSHLGSSEDDEHWLEVMDESGVEYAHVGLVDGPGNEIADYCAAVLELRSLLRRHKHVLVYDHEGSVALVVALMYLNLMEGRYLPDPTGCTIWCRRSTWEEQLAKHSQKTELPKVHPAHVETFNRLPYSLLEVL